MRIPPTEREVQAQIVKLFRIAGLEVWSSSQYRSSHTAEGFPDLWVAHRARPGIAFFFETKRPRPLVSFDPHVQQTWEPEPLDPAQVLFRDYCRLAKIPHYWGGPREAWEALVDQDLAYQLDGIPTLRIAPLGGAPLTSWLETLKGLRTRLKAAKIQRSLRRQQ